LRKRDTIANRKRIRIEWGDCDPARIVYFPRYFSYFDNCTTALFKKVGLSKREMLKKYRIIGIPVVNLQARFISPSRFSDDVIVESAVNRWGRSSFCVRHKLLKGDALAVECFETRVWAGLSATDPEKLRVGQFQRK
jgi:4-hydroxybenzoyl-CoA thioesterase